MRNAVALKAAAEDGGEASLLSPFFGILPCAATISKLAE
jgi:hypothetical protein